MVQLKVYLSGDYKEEVDLGGDKPQSMATLLPLMKSRLSELGYKFHTLDAYRHVAGRQVLQKLMATDNVPDQIRVDLDVIPQPVVPEMPSIEIVETGGNYAMCKVRTNSSLTLELWCSLEGRESAEHEWRALPSKERSTGKTWVVVVTDLKPECKYEIRARFLRGTTWTPWCYTQAATTQLKQKPAKPARPRASAGDHKNVTESKQSGGSGLGHSSSVGAATNGDAAKLPAAPALSQNGGDSALSSPAANAAASRAIVANAMIAAAPAVPSDPVLAAKQADQSARLEIVKAAIKKRAGPGAGSAAAAAAGSEARAGKEPPRKKAKTEPRPKPKPKLKSKSKKPQPPPAEQPDTPMETEGEPEQLSQRSSSSSSPATDTDTDEDLMKPASAVVGKSGDGSNSGSKPAAKAVAPKSKGGLRRGKASAAAVGSAAGAPATAASAADPMDTSASDAPAAAHASELGNGSAGPEQRDASKQAQQQKQVFASAEQSASQPQQQGPGTPASFASAERCRMCGLAEATAVSGCGHSFCSGCSTRVQWCGWCGSKIAISVHKIQHSSACLRCSAPAACVLVPCGHVAFCAECAGKMETCEVDGCGKRVAGVQLLQS